MSRRVELRKLALACAGCALLATSGVSAETYSILEGTLFPAGGGEPQELVGAFDVSLFDPGSGGADDRTVGKRDLPAG